MDDVACPHCQASLEDRVVRRSSRGRRYVYGKRRADLSPEVIWLLIVILVGLIIIVGAQVLAFMRARKLVQYDRPVMIVAAANAGNLKDRKHETRLRNLRHADRAARNGYSGSGGHRI